MTEFSKEEDSVMLCRIVEGGSGETRVQYLPQSTDEVQMQMWTNLGSRFEEKAMAYQAARRQDGQPDRSKFTDRSSE